MKNWKFVKTGNDSLITKEGRVNYPDKEIGEINILKRELEGLMRMAQSDKTHDYTKQIEALKKEISEKKNKYAVGNESIEKQEWSMFKGLSKDAEKEVGNAWTSADEKRLDELARKKATHLSDKEWKEFQELIKRSEQASKDFFKKTGNARPKEQLLADVRELTKYIQEHNGQGCEKEKRLLGEAKEELDKNYGVLVNNLKRARNAMTKNAMGIADLEAQIKKNEEYIKSLQGKTVDSEGWSAKASIQEAQDEIDRMKSRIEELKKQGNKRIGNLDSVEEGDYVDVRVQGEIVEGVVRKVQGTQALVTVDGVDQWFPIRSLKQQS